METSLRDFFWEEMRTQGKLQNDLTEQIMQPSER